MLTSICLHFLLVYKFFLFHLGNSLKSLGNRFGIQNVILGEQISSSRSPITFTNELEAILIIDSYKI